MNKPGLSEFQLQSPAGAATASAARSPDIEPILVVVQHSELLAHPCLNETFRGDDGLLLIRCPQGDPRAYTSTLHLPCVYIAHQSVMDSMADLTANAYLQPKSQQALVLLMGPPLSGDEIKNLILAGAMGYIAEDAPLSQIKNAVRALARGEYWAERTILAELIRELITVPAITALTVRELEVLRLLPSGYTNRIIADTLGITYETVRWHLRSIYAKLGVKDRIGAIARAKQIRSPRSSAVTASAKLAFIKPDFSTSRDHRKRL